MADGTSRYYISKNEPHLLILKNFFTFADRPNAERVNNFKIFYNGIEKYVHIKIENGRDVMTGLEKSCNFRMDLETAKALKEWLDGVC